MKQPYNTYEMHLTKLTLWLGRRLLLVGWRVRSRRDSSDWIRQNGRRRSCLVRSPSSRRSCWSSQLQRPLVTRDLDTQQLNPDRITRNVTNETSPSNDDVATLYEEHELVKELVKVEVDARHSLSGYRSILWRFDIPNSDHNQTKTKLNHRVKAI